MSEPKPDLDVREIENASPPYEHDAVTARGFAIESDELPKGYYLSPRFIGAFLAVGMNLLSSTGGFALIAPVLSQIDIALSPPGEPSPAITWLALVYTIGLAVGLTLVGRLSDIFGRRWFFIGGTVLGAVGAAVAGTAKTLPVAIGGQTLVGLSACTGYSYSFVMGELVPVKYRFLANAVIFAFSLPTAGVGPAVSTGFILSTGPGWRWCYYFLIIANMVPAMLYFFFYHPPTFRMKHGDDSVAKWVKNFDYGGLILYCAGLILFILGLQAGGTLYPWASGQVISMIVIGLLCLVGLFVYETYMPLKEPLIPMHLFKNFPWVATVLNLAINASMYYSQAIIWPSMAANVYGMGRVKWAAGVATLVGLGITLGEMAGGALAKHIGKARYQMLTATSIGVIFLGVMATSTIDSTGQAIAIVFIACFAVGYNEAISLPVCIIAIKDQRDIGTAAGIAGSARSAISTVASTVYTVVLSHREATTLSTIVPDRLTAAGLPPSSVSEYMTAIAAGGAPSALAAVKGLTPRIEAAGTLAYRVAYLAAYRSVFYTSIAFGVLAIGITFFTPNVDHLMTESIAATLQGGKDKATLAEQYHHKEKADLKTDRLMRFLQF